MCIFFSNYSPFIYSFGDSFLLLLSLSSQFLSFSYPAKDVVLSPVHWSFSLFCSSSFVIIRRSLLFQVHKLNTLIIQDQEIREGERSEERKKKKDSNQERNHKKKGLTQLEYISKRLWLFPSFSLLFFSGKGEKVKKKRERKERSSVHFITNDYYNTSNQKFTSFEYWKHFFLCQFLHLEKKSRNPENWVEIKKNFGLIWQKIRALNYCW